MRRLVLLGLASCLLAGCASDEARISFVVAALDQISVDELELRVSDGRTRRTLERRDFGSLSFGEAGPFATASAGNLDIEFVLRSGADTVSAGAIRLRLRPDWQWGVRVAPDSADPTRFCFGCMGHAGFAIRTAQAAFDSVYLVWSGNSISDPVVY